MMTRKVSVASGEEMNASVVGIGYNAQIADESDKVPKGIDDMKVKRVTISQIDGEIVARIEFADVDKTGFMSTEDRNPSRGLGVYLGPSWEDDVASKPGAHGVVLRGVSDDPSVMEAWEAFMAALDGSGRVEVGQVIWEADDEG